MRSPNGSGQSIGNGGASRLAENLVLARSRNSKNELNTRLLKQGRDLLAEISVVDLVNFLGGFSRRYRDLCEPG